MIRTQPHERFSTQLSLEPDAARAFAGAVGDTNPLHHDAEFAAATRFGRLLASGPQTTAHLLALTASHFSQRGAVLGLEFWVRFRRPIYADAVDQWRSYEPWLGPLKDALGNLIDRYPSNSMAPSS